MFATNVKAFENEQFSVIEIPEPSFKNCELNQRTVMGEKKANGGINSSHLMWLFCFLLFFKWVCVSNV